MKIKYSSMAMSRNKYSSFRTAERVWETLFKANVTVLLTVLINSVNISRLNWIGRQLQPVELAAGELAVNLQTTSAWSTQQSEAPGARLQIKCAITENTQILTM